MKVDLRQESPLTLYDALLGGIDAVYGDGAHRNSYLMDVFMRLNVGLDHGLVQLENANNL